MFIALVENERANLLEKKYNGNHMAINFFKKPYEMPLSITRPIFESFGAGNRMIAYVGKDEKFLTELKSESILCIEIDSEQGEKLYSALASLQKPYFHPERDIKKVIKEFLKTEIGEGNYRIVD
jgi:hypothetical protein